MVGLNSQVSAVRKKKLGNKLPAWSTCLTSVGSVRGQTRGAVNMQHIAETSKMGLCLEFTHFRNPRAHYSTHGV